MAIIFFLFFDGLILDLLFLGASDNRNYCHGARCNHEAAHNGSYDKGYNRLYPHLYVHFEIRAHFDHTNIHQIDRLGPCSVWKENFKKYVSL